MNDNQGSIENDKKNKQANKKKQNKNQGLDPTSWAEVVHCPRSSVVLKVLSQLSASEDQLLLEGLRILSLRSPIGIALQVCGIPDCFLVVKGEPKD